MRKLTLPLCLMMLLLLPSCGLQIGPQVKTEVVVVRPGHPAQIVENKTILLIQPEGASQPVEQDVGGWYAVPREHYEALMRALDVKK